MWFVVCDVVSCDTVLTFRIVSVSAGTVTGWSHSGLVCCITAQVHVQVHVQVQVRTGTRIGVA